MKILLVNGSPHEHGSTYTVLAEIADTFHGEGADADIFWIGNQPIQSCVDCGGCTKNGCCVFDDKVNEFLEIAGDYDGFIFGSPVHYAAATGAMTAFMGRVFFADVHSGKERFYLKPAAAVTVARRAGATAALEQLNKYFLWGHMPIISSRYWNVVYGANPDEVKKDAEGRRNLHKLAKNMVWFLKCKEAGEKSGVEPPVYD